MGDSMIDVMILGAGGVGCVVGGCLSHKGFQIQLVNRQYFTAMAVAKNGLRLEFDTGIQISQPDAVVTANAQPAKFIMCFTKTHQTKAAIKAILPVICKDTIMVSMQNGLGNGSLLARLTGCDVLHGVTMIPATVLAPAHIRSHGSHHSWIGPLEISSQRQQAAAKELATMLEQSGLSTEYLDDVRTKIWQKACFNVAMNGVAALADAPPGLIGDTAPLMVEVHALADEALAVAASLGIGVDPKQVHELIDFACAEHRYHMPSMMQDIRASRQTEIESLNGYIVEQANAIGLEVPRNRLINALVQARQSANQFWKDQS